MSQDERHRKAWKIAAGLMVVAIMLSFALLPRLPIAPGEQPATRSPALPSLAPEHAHSTPELPADGDYDSGECVDEVASRISEMSSALHSGYQTSTQYISGEVLPVAQEVLFGSLNPEHQYAGLFLYADSQPNATWRWDRDAASSKIDELLNLDTTDPLLLWHGLRLCNERDESDCPSDALEDRALAAGRDNSEIWMQVALSRYFRGEVDGALNAMQFAGSAPISTYYWSETVQMIDRALSAVTDLTFEQRSLVAHAANFPWPDFDSVIRMCVEQSRVDSAWTKACQAYGTAIERQHQTVTGQSYGIDLQVSMESDRVVRQELTDRRRALEEEYLANQTELVGMVHIMIHSDPSYFEGYWRSIGQKGETEGFLDFAELEIPEFLRELDLGRCASTVLNRNR